MKTNNNENLIPFMLLGDTCVGKTCLIQNFAKEKFDINTISTIGHDFKNKNIEIKKNGEKKSFVLKIWDTAGQERFKSQCLMPLKNSLGVMLVYDITNKKTFEDVKDWIDLISENITSNNNHFTIILVGNKTDLEDDREISYEEGEKLAKDYKYSFYETSALNGSNVEEAFMDLVNKIINKYQYMNRKSFHLTTYKIPDKKKNKIKCC